MFSLLNLLVISKAPTWLGGCCTRVWRRVQHPTPLPTHQCRVWVYLFFFFSLIRTDSARFALNQTDSAWIRLHRLNWVVLAGDQNRPKSALNHARTAEIGFEWGPNILNLSFLDFILNIWCFFCVFFFVLCFSPSSFFVLWIKTMVMWFLRIF